MDRIVQCAKFPGGNVAAEAIVGDTNSTIQRSILHERHVVGDRDIDFRKTLFDVDSARVGKLAARQPAAEPARNRVGNLGIGIGDEDQIFFAILAAYSGPNWALSPQIKQRARSGY